MKRFWVLCAVGCLFFVMANVTSVSHAQTLFEENWDSYGTETMPDSADWTLSQVGIDNNAFVVIDAVDGDPEGTGDKALMYVGWGEDDPAPGASNGNWRDTIESFAIYNRANNCDLGPDPSCEDLAAECDGLVMEFTAWVEGIDGNRQASGLGFNGPFHDPTVDNNPDDPNATIKFNTVEFGTTHLWSSLQWGESRVWTGQCACNPEQRDWPLFHSGRGQANSGPDQLQSRLGYSLGKFEKETPARIDRAVRMRYTLGACQGGKIEWLDVTEDPPVWVSEGDFRDGNLGPVYTTMTPGGEPGIDFQQGLSSLPQVRLGFLTLGFGTGHVGGVWPGNGNQELDDKTGIQRDGMFIDDIIVYAGAPTTGACNLTGGCQVLTQTDCLAQSGTYIGDATECMAVFNIPGDCNQDGAFDLSDVVHLLGFLFQGSPEDLPCSTEAANLALMDCNKDGGVDLSDAIYKLAFLFQGGPPAVQGEGCTEIPDCPQNQACP